MKIDLMSGLCVRPKTPHPRSTGFACFTQRSRGDVPSKPDGNLGRESSTVPQAPIGVPDLAGGRAVELRARCRETLAVTASGVAMPKAAATEIPSIAELTDDRALVQALGHSRIFAEYQRAFTGATGLPVGLQPVESFRLPDHGRGKKNAFCALLAQKGRSCAECLSLQARVKEAARCSPHTAVCHAGLSETAVPIRLGNRLIGFLQTGQVFRQSPTERQFHRTVEWLESLRVDLDEEELRTAYFSTRVVAGDEHASATKLLSLFAEHLSILGNQITLQQSNAEPPWVARAKAFVREHYAEDLRLAEVAQFVNMSPFYFCKRFKQSTALTFTGYLSRVRIESCKNLLQNPNLRVSEIGYEVGFETLPHFNRVFRRIVGQTPTEFRRACGVEL